MSAQLVHVLIGAVAKVTFAFRPMVDTVNRLEIGGAYSVTVNPIN